jgi:hypothetical protein
MVPRIAWKNDNTVNLHGTFLYFYMEARCNRCASFFEKNFEQFFDLALDKNQKIK